jgi:hypothetical protein
MVSMLNNKKIREKFFYILVVIEIVIISVIITIIDVAHRIIHL